MAYPATETEYQDSQIWHELKAAIATSSGFQRWRLEQMSSNQIQNLSEDHQVRRYLRQTLETLAY